jgi:hypothetical protein
VTDNRQPSTFTTNLIHLLRQQIRWSREAFGPGARTDGVLAHITKEIIEIRDEPDDLEEWIDLIILGFDGAWRSGGVRTPEEIVSMLNYKYEKNFGRTWPDWRTVPEGEPIEHIETDEDAEAHLRELLTNSDYTEGAEHA